MYKKLALLASILASWATSAGASESQPRVSKLPFYEVEIRCDGIARGAGSRSAYAECIYREQLAYDALKPRWASLPAATQVQCDQVARAESGIGSYATLNACVTQGKIPQQEFAQSVPNGPASAPRIVAPTVETSVWKGEFGGRYWYSSGRTQYGLFGLPPELAPTNLVSRLTYTGLTGHAGELFGRVDHWSGVFVKVNVGVGTIPNGNLQDEDFPPFPPFLPQVYSSTNSPQNGGSLGYLSADVGWAFWQPLNALPASRLDPSRLFPLRRNIERAWLYADCRKSSDLCAKHSNLRREHYRKDSVERGPRGTKRRVED